MVTIVGIILILIGTFFAFGVSKDFIKYGGLVLERRAHAERVHPLVAGLVFTMTGAMILGGLYLVVPPSAPFCM